MSTIDQRTGRLANRRFAVLVAAVLTLAMVPATAAAQSDPTADQYGDTLEQISQGGGGENTSAPDDSPSTPPSGASDEGAEQVGGGLPFTGLDVAALAVVALALGGAGLLLHRRSREASG